MTKPRTVGRQTSKRQVTMFASCVLVGFSALAQAQQPRSQAPATPPLAAAPAPATPAAARVVPPVAAVRPPAAPALAPAASSAPAVAKPPTATAPIVPSAVPAGKATMAAPTAVVAPSKAGASDPAVTQGALAPAVAAPAMAGAAPPPAVVPATSPANALTRPPGPPAAKHNVAAIAPAVASPKPAPELEQLKVLEGHWRCDGRAPAGPSGPEHAYKSTWKFKRDLDNFWWAAEYQQTKAKNNPQPIKARGFLTYDPASKTFVMMGVDNMGGTSTESTAGWSGDVVTLAGDANLAGKKVPYREVITKKGTREFTWRGEMKIGGDWVTLGEDRCKK